MAHQIDMTTGRPAMAYVGNKPWHGLGEQLAQGATIEEWIAAARMGFEIKRSAVHFQTEGSNAMDTWEARNVLYRGDTGRPLGVVSNKYQIVQPTQVLEFFRDLTEDMGFVMETAGVLFDGGRFWALERVTADVAMLDSRDKVGGYLLLSTSADGTLATTARFTTIRVVCNNTLSVAIDGKAAYTLSHAGEFDADRAKAAIGIKGDTLREGFGEAMDGLRKLGSKTMTLNDTIEATMRLFDYDMSKMTPAEIAKAAKGRAVKAIGDMAITGAGLVGADLKGGQGTAWGWLNAVTQHVDHMTGNRTQDRRLDSAWFGQGNALKRKALMIAQEMADGSVQFVEREQTDAEFDGDVLGQILEASTAS